RRNQVLLQYLNRRMAAKNAALIGGVIEVLVEGRSDKGPRRMFGRSPTNKIVVVEGAEGLVGHIVPIRVERATATTLYGYVMGEGGDEFLG
ncbi:MAG: TRAM domain-containing protein, partial [Verrucomicrobiae bacterium]|nr:TRAM domain-containing protein [Verrucomicrobiae bacterium]